jgi:hypothetical protein
MLLVDMVFSNSSSIYKRTDKPKIPKFRYFLVGKQQSLREDLLKKSPGYVSILRLW